MFYGMACCPNTINLRSFKALKPAGFKEEFRINVSGTVTAIQTALRPMQKTGQAKPIISGGDPAPHPLQGIGAGFIPEVLDKSLLDGVITVKQEEAYDFTRMAALKEGLFLGISSGASLAAINKKAPDIPKGSRILTFCYDTGERYLSIDGLFV